MRNVLKWFVGGALILWPLLYLTTTINDDAFVYYTYAKNFARGNFFAYDPRGIPSEGFTSVLYMVILVPFEMLHVPLSLAALLINIISILTGLMGWGLETIVNIPIFLGLVYRFLLLTKSGKVNDFNAVLVLYAGSVLVRPENLVLGAPWVFIGYLSLCSKKEGNQSVSIFLLSAAAVLFFKYQIFGDLVPTGFYRKMSSQSLNANYLKNYFTEYSLIFHPVYWLGFACLMLCPADTRENRALKKAILGLVLMLVGLIVFILKVEPIQGYLQRYLTMATVSTYLIASILFVLIVPRKRTFEFCILVLGVGILFSGIQQRQRANPLALYRESVQQLNQDPYVAFGRYLQKSLRNPREVSLMFGDAGSIPYFFDCKFFDINGLTEPYIARMFKADKREEKVSEYISNKKIDMAVLAVENQWINLSKDSQHLPQGPLKTPREYAHLLRKMKSDGFAYAGTIHAAVYDLHFGLNKKSPNFADLKKVLSKYMTQGKGFIKDSDLRLEFSDGDVVFENIHRSVIPQNDDQGISKNL